MSPVQVIDDPGRSGGLASYAGIIGGLLQHVYQKQEAEKAKEEALQQQAARNYVQLASGANMSPYEAGQALPTGLASNPAVGPLAGAQQSPRDAAAAKLAAVRGKEQERLLGINPNDASTSLEDYIGNREALTGKPVGKEAYQAHLLSQYASMSDTNADGSPNPTKQAIGVRLKVLSDANTDARVDTQTTLAKQHDDTMRELAKQREELSAKLNEMRQQQRMDSQTRSIEASMERTLAAVNGRIMAAGIVPQGQGALQPAPGGQPLVAGPSTDLRGKLSPDTINVLKNPGFKIPAKYYQELSSREIQSLSALAGVSLTTPQAPSGDDNKRIVASGLATRNIESISELTHFFQQAGAPITGPAIGRYVRLQKKTGSSLDFLGDILGGAPDRPLTSQEQATLKQLPSVVSLDDSGNVVSGGTLNATTLRQAWNQAAQQVLMFENYLNAAETSATLPRNSAQSILDKFEAVGPNNVQGYSQLLGNLAGLKEHANNVRYEVLSRLYGGSVPYIDGKGMLYIYSSPKSRKAVGRVQ